MARRRTHVIVGAPAGTAMAAYTAWGQTTPNLLLEAVGGVFGGAVGALLPDVLEPPINSWHRSFAHSYTAAGIGIAAIPQRIATWQEHCRAEAARHDQLRECSTDEWTRIWHALCASFWRVLSGFTVGIATGYASHLVLDLATPRGLPMLI